MDFSRAVEEDHVVIKNLLRNYGFKSPQEWKDEEEGREGQGREQE